MEMDEITPVELDLASLFKRYRTPRYWPIWIGLGAMRVAAALPLRTALRLGFALGRGLGWLARRRCHVAAVNLRLCFPELDAGARAQLLEANLAATGMGLLEIALCWWAPDAALRERVEIEGLEHYDAALARGKGAILLTGHFTTLELGAGLFALHRPFHAMYRPHGNPLYDTVMRWARERRSRMATIPRDDVRAMLRALKRGETVWYAPDQDYGGTDSVFVPFFGIPARTITATSRFARITGAAVVPYYPERLADGRYRIRVLPALEGFPSDDEFRDAARINALIEGWVRAVPEQYLWVHRRFKGRPPGEPKLY